MNNVLGIIAEYNPFHKGHAFHLSEAKRLSGADTIVCIMSGDFVQRGEPALANKYIRAEAAVRSGVDLVLELPFVYATTGAENFAKGAIEILAGLNVIDVISFGSESCDKEKLSNVAKLLANEDAKLSKAILSELKIGVSYPVARQKAVAAVYGQEEASMLERPNDILAIEYLKQLHLLGDQASEIDVCPVKRKGPAPDAIEGDIAGATAIRDILLHDSRKSRKEAFSYMPESSVNIYKKVKEFTFLNDMFDAFQYASFNLSAEMASNIYGVAEGLENKILSASEKVTTYEELIQVVKSKRYTQTRIQRLLLHYVTGLTKNDVTKAKNERLCTKILGFNDKGANLLKKIKKGAGDNSPVLISNIKRQAHDLKKSPTTLKYEIKADKLYEIISKGNLKDFKYNKKPFCL